MKNALKVISAALVVSSMVGCTGMNGSFGCDATAGRGCTPVSTVNDRADSGYYTYAASGGKQIKMRSSEAFGIGNRGFSYPEGFIRTNERIQRIWIAPYQDLSNNYHDSSIVYAVLEKPHWAGRPEKAIETTETQQDD